MRHCKIALVLAVLIAFPARVGAQVLSDSNPMGDVAGRLKNLSRILETRLKTTSAVNRAAAGSIKQQKKGGMLIAEMKGVGATVPLENYLKFQNLEPRLMPLQIDVLQDHQRQLQDFSKTLGKAIDDVSSLSSKEAKARLDAIVVPFDVRQILIQGAGGSALPLPPHLQSASLDLPGTLTPYVVGPGSAATVEYPAVAEIAYSWLGHGSSAICTGTLVSADAVLTAAHCFCELAKMKDGRSCLSATYPRGMETVKATDPRFLTVYFHDRGPLSVKEVVIHPDYAFPKRDLAIIRLKETVPDIMPAPLNDRRPLKPGEYATIVGFGMHGPMKADGTPAPGSPVRASEGLKLWATVRTSACRDANLDGAICWNYQEREGDRILGSTCHGDSGGPSFATIDGVVRMVGVTSGGPDDCHAGTDQSYDVDVMRNLTWIGAQTDLGKSVAFAANANAFISNPGNRAYGSPYHLFVSQPDESNATFFLPASLLGVRVSVNTTPTFASLRLEVFAPGSSQAACNAKGNDAFLTCFIASPVEGTWQARVTGSGPQESQVVAVGVR